MPQTYTWLHCTPSTRTYTHTQHTSPYISTPPPQPLFFSVLLLITSQSPSSRFLCSASTYITPSRTAYTLPPSVPSVSPDYLPQSHNLSNTPYIYFEPITTAPTLCFDFYTLFTSFYHHYPIKLDQKQVKSKLHIDHNSAIFQ